MDLKLWNKDWLYNLMFGPLGLARHERVFSTLKMVYRTASNKENLTV